MTEDYAHLHGSYEGCILNISDIQAALFIDNRAKIWWYEQICIKDDHRPPKVDYYPSLELQQEWL